MTKRYYIEASEEAKRAAMIELPIGQCPRTHLSLGKDTLLLRAIQRDGRIQSVPHLGGLHRCLIRIQYSTGTARANCGS